MSGKESNNAYEYLYATIQIADWIGDDYKRIAEQYREHEALKELYLCICDGVSVDLLEVMAIEKDTGESLRKCRKKHLESDFLRKYSDVVERISVITAKTEHEVKNMSATVNYIADSLPVKTVESELLEPIIVMEEMDESEPLETGKEDVIDIPIAVVSETTQKNYKRGRTWFKPFFALLDKYRRNPGRTAVEMLAQGYTDEHISFIFECIEEGMTAKEIDRIASPKIKVETMKQLKKVVLKERERNGQQQRN